MPFAYYAHLTPAQRAVYRRSDRVTELRLPHADLFRPLIEDLTAALASESRARTQAASARLVDGLVRALGLPPVEVQVLAVRPHRRWGELHGLYTAEPGRPPRIQLWMRTAKRRRVVAFRTYLRTLLHELGHHIDYTLLGLPESFHTEGFYKRESSLFHQLLKEDVAMPTLEEYAQKPLGERLGRLRRTPEDLAVALQHRADADLRRRPDPKNWAAVEIVCHLRDTEELFQSRFQQILAMDEPHLLPVDPDRWAEERQYLRHDAAHALGAFRRRRGETLALLEPLRPEQWQRGGLHATRGRMTVEDLVTLMAWHDDNHLDQLRRALEGRP
jgi:hypothetical protein